ncbi:15137_t:CDS:2 [Gigaspora margarita]|uniref:15137_t:CDS:1 n=1 Tax=Gigaspora margarita TaxID=4874 RepID=A0ABN7V5M6_GIGMA|nr:15137_t:CDS:2 [Gigaspora margarita]
MPILKEKSTMKLKKWEIDINQEDNEALKVIEKAAKIDFVDEIIKPSFENYIEIDKKTPKKKSQELVKIDR